jgi:hypothetical protein
MAFIDMGDQFVALAEGRSQARDDHRHFGLVVDDKAAVRRALASAGVEIRPGRGLDFHDPWGNLVQVVEYGDIQFTKDAAVLKGMGLGQLPKSESALRELEHQGAASARRALNPSRARVSLTDVSGIRGRARRQIRNRRPASLRGDRICRDNIRPLFLNATLEHCSAAARCDSLWPTALATCSGRCSERLRLKIGRTGEPSTRAPSAPRMAPGLSEGESKMPKVSKDSATQGGEFGPVTDRSDQLEGYTVNFTSFADDVDATPLLKGAPDDRCQCPHWGYVLSGKVTFAFADREEIFEAGDAFYTPPGHIPVKHEPGTKFVMFSPAEELKKTEEVMMKNMQAMEAG